MKGARAGARKHVRSRSPPGRGGRAPSRDARRAARIMGPGGAERGGNAAPARAAASPRPRRLRGSDRRRVGGGSPSPRRGSGSESALEITSTVQEDTTIMRDWKLIAVGLALLGAGVAWLTLSRSEPPEDALRSGASAAADLSPDRTAPRSAQPARSSATQPAPRAETAAASGAPVAAPPPAPLARKDPYGVPLAGVSGNVVSAVTGEAVAGAAVALRLDVSPNPALQLPLAGTAIRAAASGADGAFFFDDVPTYDDYLLEVAHPEHVLQRIPLRALIPGETFACTVTLGGGVEIEGTVRDEAGRTLAGATITVRMAREATVDPARSVERSVVSGAGGRFSLQPIGVGTKSIDCALAGFATAFQTNVALDPRATKRTVDFVLKAGAAIRGRVVDDQNRGVQGVQISAFPVALGRAPAVLTVQVQSGAGGEFTIDGLDAGAYVVSAWRPGLAAPARCNATAGQSQHVEIVVPRTSVIRGRVVDEEGGAPIAAFDLVMSMTERLTFRSKDRTQRVFDANGSFEFVLPTVAPNVRKVYLFALAPGYAGGRAEVEIVAEGYRPPPPEVDERNIVIHRPHPPIEVDGVVVTMRRGARITGRVVDAQRQPVGDARLTVVPAAGEGEGEAAAYRLLAFFDAGAREGRSAALAFSGEDGRFEISGMLPGRYHLRVEHDDVAMLQT
jgi:hypothetical protein